jgi:methionine aminopeptidase
MTAQDALRASIGSCKPEIDEIEKMIKKACNGGKVVIHVNEISNAAQSYFKSNGYEVFSMNFSGETHTQISWRNPK